MNTFSTFVASPRRACGSHIGDLDKNYMRPARSRVYGLLLASFLLAPGFALATPTCVTGTLASVISLGSCTIGDATFSFNPTPYGVWYTGLTSSDSVYGPAALDVTFTPFASASTAGFNLAGAFNTIGSTSSYFPGPQNYQVGNRMSIQFGYVGVSTSGGTLIDGVQLAMNGVTGSTDNAVNQLFVTDYRATAYAQGNGATRLSDLASFDPTDNFLDLLFVRDWNYSSDSSSLLGFTDFSYSVHLQSTAPPVGGTVPEPATLALSSLALAGLAFTRRKRNSVQG